jgi:hypothetical protein
MRSTRGVTNVWIWGLVLSVLTVACDLIPRVSLGEIQGTKIKDKSFVLNLGGTRVIWFIRASTGMTNSPLLKQTVRVYVVNKRKSPLMVQFSAGERLTLTNGGSAILYTGPLGGFVERAVGLDGPVLYTDNKVIKAELIFRFDSESDFPLPIKLSATAN